MMLSEDVYRDAVAKMNSIEERYGVDALHEWLRQAFASSEQAVDYLRRKQRTLAETVLAWPEARGRMFTVDDARLLGVCRVCRKPAKAPFVFNFGDEHACKGCVPANSARRA